MIMSIDFISNINLNEQEILNFKIHSLTSHPDPAEGKIYFNSTDKKYYGYNGTAWIELGGGSGETIDLVNGDILLISGYPRVVNLTKSGQTFTYNNGVLESVSDSYGTKTFTYSNGVLVGVTGTGKYQSKTFNYTNGLLSSTTIV